MAETNYLRAIFLPGWRAWGAALSEVAVISGVSLVPLFGAALREILPLDSKIYLSGAFEKAFLSGQLLFYALGLIATVLWQANKDWESFFPLRTIFNLYSLICISFSTLVIGFDPKLESINRKILIPFSLIIFGTSIVAYAIMALIARVPVNIGKALAANDAALSDAVTRSRGLKDD